MTLKKVIYFLKENKTYVNLFFLIVGVIIIINILGSSLSTRDSKIAKNTELRDMFHQTRSEEHLRSAEKNWMEKFFNIKF